MKQQVIRLLISDDVGIGKTIEASMIAKELIDRGEVDRMAVVCPPQLAEQGQRELEEKFHISEELFLPSTVVRLERGLSVGTSLFEAYPYTIVSPDYIKNHRHRDEFVRACPDFVIIDEAHACAFLRGNGETQKRYELIRKLAEHQNRHMLFVSATPYSGKEDVFRSSSRSSLRSLKSCPKTCPVHRMSLLSRRWRSTSFREGAEISVCIEQTAHS